MVHSAANANALPREAAVLAKAVSRLAGHMQLTNAVLARVLGLSEPTVSRLRNGAYGPQRGSKPFELAQLLVRLFRGLDAMTGSDDAAARSWLRGANTALQGQRPIDLIQTIPGLMAVVSYIDARRAVV